ncbi:hypothetical protein EYV94_11320 [Puteibacter caeruleilacunae]|nr:hypothetical protein EYV94_11320 [Puteibacter caeruleilacunae]
MTKMKNLWMSFLVCLTLFGLLSSCSKDGVYTIENDSLSRVLKVENGVLKTEQLANKRNQRVLKPIACNEFELRISEGTETSGTDQVLTNMDFKVNGVEVKSEGNAEHLIFTLKGVKQPLALTVHYILNKDEFYVRKYIDIKSEGRVVLERVDVESIAFDDAKQLYQHKQITAQGPSRWRPGLGQPLYTTKTATFWGIEFPASTNIVENQVMKCGYLWGNEIPAEGYTSYKAVMGVADDANYIDDSFYQYIENIRIRPLRMQVQYNSWFDFGPRVTKESFRASVRKINDELVAKRGVKPLQAYVIDDGWQDSRRKESDWSDKVWKINEKFDPQFKGTMALLDSVKSDLGLWLSPGCFFGARPMVNKMGEQGFESLTLSMSMCGPKYMDKLETRVQELQQEGVQYFKFDGLFGHLNIRDFELKGRGCPKMPQLNVEGLKNNDKELNDAKYDELKTYYLVAGTERLIEIFKKMAKVDPDVFLAITNGAYLSPWWMQYIDVVWLINCGDAAGGSNRTDELVYRDGVYYEIWEKESTKFPMSAIFNHEPKKTKTGEDADTFRRYLLMNMSRGTGFIELYIKTAKLSSSDWDVMAEGLKWAHKAFPAFEKVRMHGGDPKKREVYGYTGWTEKQGFISIHNPSKEKKSYAVKLNRKLGVVTEDAYNVSSTLKGDMKGLNASYRKGDVLTVELEPGEIRILDFNK